MLDTSRSVRSRRLLGTTLALIALSGAVAFPLGCATKAKNYARPIGKANPAAATAKASKPPRNQPASGASGQVDWADAIARSDLREKAINLLATLASSPSAEQRTNALEGLSEVPTRLEGAVRVGLTDESPAVRAVSATLVGKQQLVNSTSFVQPLLNDQVVFVRASTLYALRRCGQNVDITPFASYLEDPSPRVRSHIAFLLGELGDASALGMLRDAVADAMPRANPAEVRLMQIQIAEARVKLGDESAVNECRAALFPARNEDLEGTALAAQIAGEIKDHASTNQLINLTALKDGSGNPMPPEIRLAAAGSLAKLGLPKGAFIAREYTGSATPALRAQAAYVLGQTGQIENLSDLDVLLNDENGLVKIAAAAAIVKITSGGQ